MTMNSKNIIIVENSQAPLEDCVLCGIKTAYPDYNIEILKDDESAYKRTLTNNFALAVIDLQFKGTNFDAFDIVRGCVLAGKPVVAIQPDGHGLEVISRNVRVPDVCSNITNVEKCEFKLNFEKVLANLLGKKVDLSVIFNQLTVDPGHTIK